jgi:copper chaperone CopZ
MKIVSKLVVGSLMMLLLVFAFSCQKATETKETEPIVTEVNIPVQGMTCGSCEHHIETEVKQKAGVVEIKADHVKALAHVKYDSSKISLDELVMAINGTGYKASRPGGSFQ